MLPILALATLTLTTPVAIDVQFTKDSVYKNETIITVKETVEQENGLYTIVLDESKLLGYCIYDDKSTEYTEGLKFDDAFVANYVITDVDLEVPHTLFVKTTYTDDIAGMLASAKDGDWSRALSNPVILIQLFYYILAAGSLIFGGFGILKSKKKKIKTLDEITSSITVKASETSNALKTEATSLVNTLVTPVFEKLRSQNQAIIEALVLAQSGDKDSKLALINLLKSTATEDISSLSNDLTKAINTATEAKEKAKEEVTKLVSNIAEGNFDKTPDDGIGGISI